MAQNYTPTISLSSTFTGQQTSSESASEIDRLLPVSGFLLHASNLINSNVQRQNCEGSRLTNGNHKKTT